MGEVLRGPVIGLGYASREGMDAFVKLVSALMGQEGLVIKIL